MACAMGPRTASAIGPTKPLFWAATWLINRPLKIECRDSKRFGLTTRASTSTALRGHLQHVQCFGISDDQGAVSA
jgi:hypothetical protein